MNDSSVDNGTPYGMEVDVKSEWDESWDLLGCDKGTDTCQPCQYHQNNKHGNHHLQHFMQYYGHNHQYQCVYWQCGYFLRWLPISLTSYFVLSSVGSGTVYGMEDDVKLEELEWDQSCLRWFGDSYQYHQQCVYLSGHYIAYFAPVLEFHLIGYCDSFTISHSSLTIWQALYRVVHLLR